mgnify:CR=1 FL=1
MDYFPSKPLVSIIVPVYKAVNTLDKCVQSVLAQSYINWELLLIDDGSPDDSGKRCDYWAGVDSRIRSFHQTNGGPSKARNLGLEQMKGKYVNFLDSDDWVDVDWLASYSLKNESFDIVFQGFVKEYNCQHSEKSSVKTVSTNDMDLSQFVTHIFDAELYGFTCVKQYRVDIINEHNLRFPEGIRYGEDTIFTSAYMQHCHTACVIENTTYHYDLSNENSLLHSHFDLKEYAYVHDTVFNYLSIYFYDAATRQYFINWYAKHLSDRMKACFRSAYTDEFTDEERKAFINNVLTFKKANKTSIRYSSNIIKHYFYIILLSTKSIPLIAGLLKKMIR